VAYYVLSTADARHAVWHAVIPAPTEPPYIFTPQPTTSDNILAIWNSSTVI